MSALPYLHMVGGVAKVGTCVTLVTNSLLIYITFYHIKNITRAYKFLIFLLAQIGVLFSILEILIHPFMHSFNASFAYFSIDPMFGASKQLRTALVLIYSVIYVVIICLIAIQFVYRYWVMTGSKHVSFFYGWKCLWWFLYVVVCSLLWSISLQQVLPDSFSLNYFRAELIDRYHRDVEEISCFLVIAYEPIGGAQHFQTRSILCIGGVSSVLIAQYIIIIYCGVRIKTEITRAMVLVSSRKNRIQSQLFKTLVLQITAPSLFYHIPVFIMYIVPYLDLEFSFPSGVMVSFFSLYPAIDSLILMWVVTEYNRVVKKFLASLLQYILEAFLLTHDNQEGTTRTED